MDTYENAYTPAPRKKSPYEDSPYESNYIEVEPVVPEMPKPAPKRRGGKGLLICVLPARGPSCISSGLRHHRPAGELVMAEPV